MTYTYRLVAFLFPILIFNFHLTAQDISYSEGPEFTNKNGAFKYVIGENNTSFYVLRLGTAGDSIQNNIEKYNKKTFELEWVKNVGFERDLGRKIPGGNEQRPHVVLVKDKIYFVLALWERKKSRRSVYIKSIKSDTGEELNKATLLIKEENYKGNANFLVSFSPDTTLILVKNNFIMKEGNGRSEISASFESYKSVTLFDLESFKEIYTKEMPTSDKGVEMTITGVSADNDGNLVCVYSHVEKPTNMFGFITAINAFNPGIAKVPVNSTQLIPFDLNLSLTDNAFPVSNTLQYDKNYNSAIITGIFIEKCKGCKRRDGTFFMKVDLNKSKILTKEYYYFDDNLQKYHNELYSFDNDKRLICITSKIDKTTEDVYTISIGGTHSIFVSHFTKEGKLVWVKTLPRGFTNYYTGFTGFSYAIKRGKFYMIYADNPENAKLDLNNYNVNDVHLQTAITGAAIVGVAIDCKTGLAEQKVLRVNEKTTANFNPISIDDLNFEAPVFNLKNRKKEQFIRFQID